MTEQEQVSHKELDRKLRQAEQQIASLQPAERPEQTVLPKLLPLPEPSPAVPRIVNRPLNAADQSAVNGGCNCSRKMPYFDWSHEESCPLYRKIVASSTRIDAAPPEVQTVPIPEDLRAFNKYLQDKRQRQLQLSIQDEETCEEIALVERIARAEATIAELLKALDIVGRESSQELMGFLDIKYHRAKSYHNSVDRTVAIVIEQNIKAAIARATGKES